MSILNWVFIGFITTSLFSYIFTKFFHADSKACKIINLISVMILIPLTGSLTISLLYDFMPDSFHMIILTFTAYVLFLAGIIFFIFDSNKFYRIFARLFTLLAFILWILLYRTIIYLYHIPLWLGFVEGVFFTTAFVATVLIIKKQKFDFYIWTAIAYLIISVFHYYTFITLIYTRSLFSIILLCGSTLFFATTLYYLLDTRKFNFKHSRFIEFSGLYVSQVLISIATILMIRQ